MTDLKKELTGVWVATITPFGEDDEIMYPTIISQYEHLQKAGIRGIIPFTPIGEFPSLVYQEKVDILRKFGTQGGKMKIYPQMGHTSLKGVLRHIIIAESAGVDGITIIPPYYYLPISQIAYYNFLKPIFEHTHLPILLYHMDPHSQIPLSMQLVEKLTQYPNFLGIIDAGIEPSYIGQIRQQFPQLLLMSGSDRNHRTWMQNGCDGLVSEVGNAYPWLFTNFYNAIQNCNKDTIQSIEKKIHNLLDLFQKYPLIAAIKYAVYLLGFPAMGTRLPMDNLTSDQRTQLKTEISKYLHQNKVLEMADACQFT